MRFMKNLIPMFAMALAIGAASLAAANKTDCPGVSGCTNAVATCCGMDLTSCTNTISCTNITSCTNMVACTNMTSCTNCLASN